MLMLSGAGVSYHHGRSISTWNGGRQGRQNCRYQCELKISEVCVGLCTRTFMCTCVCKCMCICVYMEEKFYVYKSMYFLALLGEEQRSKDIPVLMSTCGTQISVSNAIHPIKRTTAP